MTITIPDKTKIFLSALWLWTWILFQISKLFNKVLKFILYRLPNTLTPTLESITRNPITILEARDNFGNVITNKVKLFMNLFWDKEFASGRGGADFEICCNYIGVSVIWIIYLMDYKLDPKYIVYLNNIQSEKFNIKSLDKFIKTAIIDVSKKLIIKYDEYAGQYTEEVLFGDYDLH